MERRRSLIRRIFHEFYSERYELIEVPSDLPKREFGFIFFKSPDIMVRHKAFNNSQELLEFLKANVPMHAYYSTAHYKWPEARSMDEKMWLGADLVFDIDVDHIPTPCKTAHDSWKCLDSNLGGKGMPPETCPKCGSKRLERDAWVCDICLQKAKEEVLKLVEDFLVSDFGFRLNEIKVYFSGHRGFHVHIESEKVQHLDSDARREIVDYIKGIGFRPSISLNGDPDMSETGWRGRMARGVYKFIADANADLLTELGFKKREITFLVTNREIILRGLESSPPYWGCLHRLSKRSLNALFDFVKRSYAVDIDERVTTDIKRLIRLPGSLHGKTGLPVVPVGISDIEEFDPFSIEILNSASSLKLKILRKIPTLKLGSREYSFKVNERVKVPFSVGLYMACRGVAEIVNVM